jgi:lipid II:glycine glycyltransferase (peptidoglycan interpeptide bridge formation enzyme)
LISKSEYYSSLPWFRRCLAMLNWRPVVDYELREIEFNRRQQQLQSELEQLRSDDERRKIAYKQRMREDEQRKIAHEQRMKQLASDIEQIERETEQLRNENARLAAIESRLARFEREHLSSSNPLSSTGDSSPS